MEWMLIVLNVLCSCFNVSSSLSILQKSSGGVSAFVVPRFFSFSLQGERFVVGGVGGSAGNLLAVLHTSATAAYTRFS